MENLKVALREYDLNRSFAQLWADKPADAYIVKEIRFSKMLWQHLLDGKDATFQIHADLLPCQQRSLVFEPRGNLQTPQ